MSREALFTVLLQQKRRSFLKAKEGGVYSWCESAVLSCRRSTVTPKCECCPGQYAGALPYGTIRFHRPLHPPYCKNSTRLAGQYSSGSSYACNDEACIGINRCHNVYVLFALCLPHGTFTRYVYIYVRCERCSVCGLQVALTLFVFVLDAVSKTLLSTILTSPVVFRYGEKLLKNKKRFTLFRSRLKHHYRAFISMEITTPVHGLKPDPREGLSHILKLAG